MSTGYFMICITVDLPPIDMITCYPFPSCVSSSAFAVSMSLADAYISYVNDST